MWTYGKDSVPAARRPADGFAEDQPIYLTAEVENPNGATILVRVDDAEAPDLAAFARCLDLFDGGDPDAVDARPRALARGGRSGPRLRLLAAGRARRLGQGAERAASA